MELHNRHMALMAPFTCFVPKHHLLWHLLSRTKWFGNPAKYATWLDESLNKVLMQACKNACSARFDASVLLRMVALLKPT